MGEKISRKVIAEKVGVSKTTVTRVLSNNGDVSEDMRKRVLSAIEELGYTRNRFAGNVGKNQNSNSIAILLPDMTNYYYLELFDKITSYTEQLDYTVSIYKLTKSNFEVMYDKMIENRVTAIINLAFIPVDDVYLKKIQSANIKIIHPGIYEDPVKINIDYEKAMRAAFASMCAAGRKNFRFICGANESFISDGRIQVFLKLMREIGCGGEENILWGRYPDVDAISEGYNLMNRALEGGSGVDGVFCFSDITAIGALKAIKEAGKEAGRDVSVVAFDNTRLSEYLIPSLSTIDSDKDKEARFYVNYILGKATGDLKIESKYIERDTTK